MNLNINIKNGILIGIGALFLSACGSTSVPTQVGTKIPPMSGAWKQFSVTKNGNVLVSYDTASIRKNGDFALMRDRNIIVNPDLEKFTDTPRYKVAVNDWEFNCKNYSYRLAASQLLDNSGNVVYKKIYTPVEIRPMPITKGSISDKQYQLACA